MADMESIPNGSNTLTSLIPEFFYVLIGRTIPGFLFIIGLVYALDKKIIYRLLFNESITLKDPEIILKYDPPYTFIFILLLIVSYASGLILSYFGELLCRIFKTSQFINFLKEFEQYVYLKTLVTVSTGISNKSMEDLKRDDCEILFQIQHDHVKKKYASQARSLSQTAAEVQLCIITAAAYLILSIFRILLAVFPQIAAIFYDKFSLSWDLLVFPVIAIISFLAARYRNERFLMRQFSFSAEIKRKEENPEKPKNKNGEWDVIIVGV